MDVYEWPCNPGGKFPPWVWWRLNTDIPQPSRMDLAIEMATKGNHNPLRPFHTLRDRLEADPSKRFADHNAQSKQFPVAPNRPPLTTWRGSFEGVAPSLKIRDDTFRGRFLASIEPNALLRQTTSPCFQCRWMNTIVRTWISTDCYTYSNHNHTLLVLRVGQVKPTRRWFDVEG